MSDEAPPFDYDMRFWRTPYGVRRAYAEIRSRQLHYRICRPREPHRIPLLCLHLSPNSGRVYEQFMAELGKDRVVVAPDTPGFGQSDAPDVAPEIPDYAAAMAELADHVGFSQYDVMGYHTGSRIAVELAQQAPGRVRRLILVSAPVYTEEELQIQYASMGTADADDTPEDGAHLLQRWQGHMQYKDRDAPTIFVQREIAEGLLGGATAWWGHRAAFRFRHAQELPKVEQPVLILCPNDDLWTPTQRAHQYLRNGSFVELPEYAHGFLDVHTAEAATLVRGFLDGPADDRPGRTRAKAAPPPPPAATMTRRAVRRAFWDGPYGQLHYRIARPAHEACVPVLMFHMSPNSGRIYEALFDELGQDRIAVAPDTPGFGESEAPRAPIEIEDFAATMGKLVDGLGFRQVDVMGYHTGAMTCIALALARPALVRRIVQISSPVFTDEELSTLRRDYRPKPMRDDGTHLRDAWVHLQQFYGPGVPRRVLARNFAESLRGGPVAHWGHRAAFNYDLRIHLQNVAQPILVINPNDDLVAQTPRGLALMQNGRLHELPRHSHGFIDVMPEEFGRVLRRFLDAAALSS